MDPKLAAAMESVRLIRDGQVVGLGSGSTAELAIIEIGKRIQNEKIEIIGIPTSKRSESVGKDSGIKVSSLDEHDVIDITIDGADEVDPNLDMIKGLGGALLREKLVAKATLNEIIVADESKMVHQLGTKAPLPVEVIQFSNVHIGRKISSLGCIPKLRKMNGEPYITDNGNCILDCSFEKGITDANELDEKMKSIPGIVETGLFIAIADVVIIGNANGVRTLRKKDLDEESLLR